MSTVTNAIFSYSLSEDDSMINHVNDFFEGLQKGFVHCDDSDLPDRWYGGSKMLETNLCIGAFNYLDEGELVDYIKSLDWKHPEDVQLFLCRQSDNRFEDVLSMD